MKPLASGPSLKHFLAQAEVRKIYRMAIRATRPLPDSTMRRETLDFLRPDLERLRGETDLEKIKDTISSFRRNLKVFAPGLELSSLTENSGAKLIGQGGKKSA